MDRRLSLGARFKLFWFLTVGMLMMAIGSSSRGGAKVIWICAHTAEGARTAKSLAAYFNQSGVNASSHVAIDAYNTLPLVPRERASWTLRSGNPRSMNAEICFFAKATRAQWLSTGTVFGCENPRAMVRRFALWAKAECEYWGIPKVHIGPLEVRVDKAGVIAHIDYTEGKRDGTHWDCGPNFPWDVVMQDMGATGGGGGAAPGREDDEVRPSEWSDADKKVVHETIMRGAPGARLIDNRIPGMNSGWLEYFIGSMPQWIIEWNLKPMRAQLAELIKLQQAHGVHGETSAEEIASLLMAGLRAEFLPAMLESVQETLSDADFDAELSDETKETLANSISEGVLTKMAQRLPNPEGTA